MLFSNILKPVDIADVYMKNIKIEYASSARFLGVIIDDKLKFNLHINEVANKVSKNADVLYKLRNFEPNNTLLTVYRSIIESHLNYCNLIFGNAFPTHLTPLVVAQKKAVRIVANKPPLSHTDPIFFNLKLLKLFDFYKYNLGVYMWRNIGKFEQNFHINIHNTRSGDHYEPGYQRLLLTQNNSIYYQAPLNWCEIPDPIIFSRSLQIFKRSYKKSILDSYQYVDY